MSEERREKERRNREDGGRLDCDKDRSVEFKQISTVLGREKMVIAEIYSKLCRMELVRNREEGEQKRCVYERGIEMKKREEIE